MARIPVTEYDYEGMTMVKEGFPAWALDKIKETLLDDSDIMVATYPKCGKFCCEMNSGFIPLRKMYFHHKEGGL